MGRLLQLKLALKGCDVTDTCNGLLVIEDSPQARAVLQAEGVEPLAIGYQRLIVSAAALEPMARLAKLQAAFAGVMA